VVELDVEIWPTCIVVPKGYRVGLSVRGKDYEYPGASGGKLSNFKNELTGCGPFLHNDPLDRPPDGVRRHHHAAFRSRPRILRAAAHRPRRLRAHDFVPPRPRGGIFPGRFRAPKRSRRRRPVLAFEGPPAAARTRS